MRFEPESIWKEDAVVKISAINIKHLLPWWNMAAGKNMKVLNFEGSFVSFSSVEDWLCLFLKAFQAKVRKIQANSPTDKPQVCKNGCLKICIFPSLPSEESVFEYLSKWYWGKSSMNVIYKVLNYLLCEYCGTSPTQ